MRIALLFNEVSEGAPADERDVLVQVAAVGEALTELGHRTEPLAVGADLEPLRRELAAGGYDAAFNLVESVGGEEREQYRVPALLESLGLPCTGSGAAALLVCDDKVAAKRRLAAAGLPTPAWVTAAQIGDPASAAASGAERWIVKSVSEHGSVGIGDDAVVSARELPARLAAAPVGSRFAEAYVEGRELNLSLLAAAGAPQVLPAAEIVFTDYPPGKPRIVGYGAKWDTASFEYHHTPRRFAFPEADRPLLAELAGLARRGWRLFGLAGYARVDFRVDGAGRPFILEVNANPCLSPDAGFAAALARAGVTYRDAVGRILDDALVTTEPAAARRALRSARS